MNSGSLSRERDPLERILEALEALDARVDAVPGAGLSLDPREPGRRATRMQALLLSAGDAPPDERVVLGEALAQVAESVLQAFPLNLFCQHFNDLIRGYSDRCPLLGG